MPNEPDHSVKIAQPDRDRDVKEMAILLGTLVGAIGALAVLFSGGASGRLLGAGMLTTLILLQISLRRERVFPPDKDLAMADFLPKRHPVSSSNTWLEDGPVLVMKLSQLGRVREIAGQVDLLPGLRIGAEFDRLLDQNAGALSQRGDISSSLAAIRLPVSDGEIILLMPEVAARAIGTQAVSDRTHFFAGLGHDLKSPLNAVIGFADVMDNQLLGPMPEAYKEYPGLIREGGQTLLGLVEDMLAYAKADAGTYELDIAELDISASAESVMRQSQAMAQKAGIRLRLAAHREVVAMADAEAVRRIWDNLVSNAIKYSASGDTVTLSAIDRGDTVLLRVSDVGAGMDADDLARIAKPFAQGRNAAGRSGSGLGLATVQRLAELQGGQVEIRTTPGAGTTVTVRLPGLAQSQKRAAE